MKGFNLRVILAFLLAPIAPCIVVVLLSVTNAGESKQVLFVIGATFVVALMLSIAIGAPTYFLLKRFWRVGFRECIAAGASIAFLFVLLVQLLPTIAFLGATIRRPMPVGTSTSIAGLRSTGCSLHCRTPGQAHYSGRA